MCKCERDPICVCLPLYYSCVDCAYTFSFDPNEVHEREEGAEKIRVFAPLGYWICWRCVQQMIALLPPRKKLSVRFAYHRRRYVFLIRLRFTPRPRVVERRKFTGYKALPEKVSRAQSSRTSPLPFVSHFAFLDETRD